MTQRNRTSMKKEVNFTKVSLYTFEIIDGKPTEVKIRDEEMVGIFNKEKAQEEMQALYANSVVTVNEIEHFKRTYQMEIAEFIKVAEVVKEEK